MSLREHPRNPEQAASHVMRDFCLATAVAQNMVVVRCEIGTASTVARSVDNLNHTDVIGTLAGDDTFVVFLKDVGNAEEMKQYLDRLRGV
jgi:transcriptional regulator of arginine metabolism